MKKFSTMSIMVLVAALVCFAALTTPAGAAWKPEKPVTLLVGNAAGGGSDLFARAIHRVITVNNLCEQPVVVVNMPGGAFAVAYAHMRDKKDPYIIAVTAGSYFTLPFTVDPPPVVFSDFVPVVHLCQDPNMIVVPKNSPFNTFEELIAFAKANPGKLKYAGSNPWSADRLLCEEINEYAGVQIQYIPFTAGSDILPAVLGGHVDMATFGPSEAAEHSKNGDMKPLAIATPERSQWMPDVRTLIEIGYPIDYQQSRTIIMEKSAPPEVVAYYSDLMRKVAEHPDWQAWLYGEGMVSKFVPHEEYVALHDELVAFHKKHVDRIKAREKK